MANDSRYGVFRLAGMQLALPLDALREVVPLQKLINLPCGNPAVLGGIDLRGLMVPVLDMRRQLDMPLDGEAQTIVIMAHDQRLLGLLADNVTGVFACDDAERHAIGAQGQGTLLNGSFSHPDTPIPISILNPAAIAALPDTPLVDDPKPAQQAIGADSQPDDAGGAEAAPNESYVLLMRCGGLPLAISSALVHSTVLNPHIHPSTLAGGYCLGSIEFADILVPAVDLTSLCGLRACGKHAQAFVIQYPQGLVAFMVEEIMDVVSADAGLAAPVPDQALQRAGFFAGVLPNTVLPAHAAELPTADCGYYFLLSGEALSSHPDLVTLSQMNTAPDGKVVARDADKAETGRTGMHGKMLTYDLGNGEIATPIEQISEILPWSHATTLLGDDGPAMGLMMNRGHAIPTFCLSTLTGQPRSALTPTASVLVVENQGGLIGFTVPRLISIDEATWAPQEDIDALAAHAALTESDKDVRQCWGRVLVNSAGDERMLNLLDLHHLATMVLHPRTAAH